MLTPYHTKGFQSIETSVINDGETIVFEVRQKNKKSDRLQRFF